MTLGYVVTLVAGALAGGFINGLAGFGTALFALGIWLQIMPAPQAVAIVVVMSVISGLQGLWIVRKEIEGNLPRLARFVVPALIGVPVGVTLLTVVSAAILKLTIAVFLILYGGFFTLRRSLPQFERPTPIADTIVGFLGGILGGSVSLSGALPTMWCAMRPWPKAETRAVLQPYNVAVLGITMLCFAWQGLYSPETLLLIALALPGTLVGSQVGIFLFRCLDTNQFRRLLIVLMFASELLLTFYELA
ncbi:sulfite exporter TauE/SafE family protein [Hyphomicrobium sp.]|uniref:sulfite exporter TauE/SafE family protein n=1 Tax=Hyphomicrobium sp. TaxID=82 RepID=UPI002FE2B2FC